MTERKPYLLRELMEPVPKDKKGMLGEFERINLWTGNKSKDLAIASGVTTIIFPGAAFITLPVAIGATFWHVGDRLQGKISQGVRGQFEKAMGKKTVNEKTVFQNHNN